MTAEPPTGIEQLAWAKPAAFKRRDQWFTAIRGDAAGIRLPVLEFAPTNDLHRWKGVREAWGQLGPQRNVMRIVDNKQTGVLVEYAALLWKLPPVELKDDYDVRNAIRWLVQLIDIHEMIGRQHAYSLDQFVDPLVKIDIWSDVRLAFLSSVPSATQEAPEFRRRWLRWSDRALVFMVGHALARIVEPRTDPRIDTIVTTCMQDRPRKRFKTLDVLREHALELFEPTEPSASELTARRSIELGLAWLELGEFQRALTEFTSASTCEALAKRAQQAADVARAQLERKATPRPRPAAAAAMSMDSFEAHWRARRYVEALEVADQLVARSGIGLTHYVRGKALFALARLEEARAAFEQALSLDGSLVEALLLRREVDRATAGVRARVGEAQPAVVDVPAALLELRDDLLSGDATRVIEKLATERFADDPEAQLVLARYLAMDNQCERALGVYDRITGEHRFTALLGKASTLLELDRNESALAIYDQLTAEKPTDAEASEGRARALEKLRRIGEAAAEYRRFISLATAGSDLRVRAAQEWLDAHPL